MLAYGQHLKARHDADKRTVEQGWHDLADVVSGRKGYADVTDVALSEDVRQMMLIARYFGQKPPSDIRPSNDPVRQIDYVLGPTGITKRHVRLGAGWWKDGDGPLLVALREGGGLRALFPTVLGGYSFVDPASGVTMVVDKRNCDQFEPDAYCFYRPMPRRSMTKADYLRFLCESVSAGDVFVVVVASLGVAAIGVLTPLVTKVAYSSIVPSGEETLLYVLATLLISCAVGAWLMRSVRMGVSERVRGRLDVVAQNAVFARVLNLPSSFFACRSTGGLAQCVAALNAVPSLLCEVVFGGVLSIGIILLYMVPVFWISSRLLLPLVATFVLQLLVLLVSVRQETRLIRAQLAGGERSYALVFDMINGMRQIRVSGSERRAYAQWLEAYSRQAGPTFDLRFPLVARDQLVDVVRLAGMLWTCAVAYSAQLGVAEFAAFSSAFGLVMGGVQTVTSCASSYAQLLAMLEMGEPILACESELRPGKRLVRRLEGLIDIDNVTFRYDEKGPAILDDLSLSIMPGEYVGIVGPTGCGKSTLLRLLLGFETCQSGGIYYDGTEMGQMDVRALRANLGCVLQDDKLFAGDIYSNIVVTAPWLGLDEAWEAAEMAGIADDIRRMPMGMRTYISEGSGSVSGGQRQRLIIARALVGKPSILLFDEATSALDNITQGIVTASLAHLDCTRIVVAHRLSTIRDCDRIVVLDGGRIREEGTYDELLARGGLFAELVAHQRV